MHIGHQKALHSDQNSQRVDCGEAFLNKFNTDPVAFAARIVMRDEDLPQPL